MNKEQKQVLQSQLNNEKRTLKELKQVYTQALKDCEKKIAELSARKDMENLQSIIYQKQYQQAIKGQLEGILEQLHSNEFATVSDYLARCYEEGYIGVMYDLQGQGIPLIIPISQEQVTQAIQTDSQLSKPMYDRLGEDVNKLKTSVRAEISRGIAAGFTWNEVAGKIAQSFQNTPFNQAYNNAMRIARTEGHRIQIQAADHAQHKAKEKGADILKQWDATMDGKTRPSHRRVDGEFRELDEPFSNGLQYPGDPSGTAKEVVNCRCALLQRAKWELDDEELDTLKERAEYFGLDKTDSFEEYKKKYLQASESVREGEQKMNDNNELENVGKSSTIKVKRGQLSTGYTGRIPDDKLDEYNKKAFEQIKLDTGYSDEKATEFHNALLEYFGGDYETIETSQDSEATKAIIEGLSKMPAYDGSISRGLCFYNMPEESAKFTSLKIGDELPHKGVIESWTSDKRTGMAYASVWSEGNSIILECADNNIGVGTQHISSFGSLEAEVTVANPSYEVVDIVIEDKYKYLSEHLNEFDSNQKFYADCYLEEKTENNGDVVVWIKVKEK